LRYELKMFQKLVALAAWGSLAFITFATLSPIGLRPEVADARYEHVAAFALAGFLFGLAYPRHIALVAMLVLGSAILLESLQLITPDRHGQLVDLEEKLVGGSIGIALALVFEACRRRKLFWHFLNLLGFRNAG
jgi:VanZ like family